MHSSECENIDVRENLSSRTHEQIKLVKGKRAEKTCSLHTQASKATKELVLCAGFKVSYLGTCYIRTKVTKCIREKMTMYFRGLTIKSHSSGYEIGSINRSV